MRDGTRENRRNDKSIHDSENILMRGKALRSVTAARRVEAMCPLAGLAPPYGIPVMHENISTS